MDRWILAFDKALRTLSKYAVSIRPHPDAHIIENTLSDKECKHAAGLMRVNHCGEVCAQALYQGQAMMAKSADLRMALAQSAKEEEEHLAWTKERVEALGSHTSILNPVWYVGALSLGILAGRVGDKWNLAFLEETEKQVGAHLKIHLQSLPPQDAKSLAIVQQMYIDEMQHADMAQRLGAAKLPAPLKLAMKWGAKMMTTVSYFI